MTAVPASLRLFVVQRAGDRCGYCGISQIGQVATFHIDHIVPVVAGGQTSEENLALACVSCSLRKGARQTFEDAETGEIVPSSILVNRYVKSILRGTVLTLLD